LDTENGFVQLGDVVTSVYENPIEYFYGRVGDLDEDDFTDEEEEAEDDGDEEIDLEKPKKKARKA
jgi:template-activating factor I